MGTLEALNTTIKGGVAPGGIWRTAEAPWAVIWATAISIFTFGWKKILVMLLPLKVWDSLCSTSFTDVVRLRSNTVAIRCSMSSALRPA